MGPGVPHCVFTLDRTGFVSVPCVMIGSHFLSCSTMSAALAVRIALMFWHDVYTNVSHDDLDYLIGRMLSHQASVGNSSSTGSPFLAGDDLFATLMMAQLSRVIRSVPYPDSDDTQEGERSNRVRQTAKWLEGYNPLAAHKAALESDDGVLTFKNAVQEGALMAVAQIVERMDDTTHQNYQFYWASVREYFSVELESRLRWSSKEDESLSNFESE